MQNPILGYSNSTPMETIQWGIIGCGDVAEVKSGPAFQNIQDSELVGVMRRNESKAKDFAKRHNVPIWTTDANDLLNNDQINAIYVATPPSTHLTYALAALQAGKNVYLEKPMALTAQEANEIVSAVDRSKAKLSVAHYRRKLPAFEKVRLLLEEGAIGKPFLADIQLFQPRQSNLIAKSDTDWRLVPEISGGGYFYDLAPHQIDLMYYFFGAFDNVSGFAYVNENMVEETVNGIMHFENKVQLRAVWNFTAPEGFQKEECVIYGSQGSIHFSFYGDQIVLRNKNGEKTFQFIPPTHIQQPMISAVVSYFKGAQDNPCSAREGALIMRAMEQLCGR